MARKVGYSETPMTQEEAQKHVFHALMKYLAFDTVVILVLVGVLMYLYTPIFGEHSLEPSQVTMYTIVSIVVMAILSIALFFLTVWPAAREARNAK